LHHFEKSTIHVVKVIDSLHINNDSKGIDHWVLLTEYCNGGDLEKHLSLKSGRNIFNKIPPNPPLSEKVIGDYFGQLRLFHIYFIFSFSFFSSLFYIIY
jgi:hypothetical protein